MKKTHLVITGLIASFAIGFYINGSLAQPSEVKHSTETIKPNNMKLGAFSISLSVKDLAASKAFYEKVGFDVFAGSMEQNYLIMKNGNALIGLFQGMFQGNILTFNPGWDENAKNVEHFDDIRDIQRQLKRAGLTLTSEADEKTSGPTNFVLTDPDGNVILFDQHR